ncbi:hypothetical protein EDD16DRAFT_1528973 [Pisolithus croceorrhizus]|nr:hypothetical protein EDD16DRAFT_1528973 [Pisolithus croceorrhizus]KAI6131774.1 hypothetical protein EV401DRAFT_1883973 [Pisolithus croceorrhizus]
MSNQPSTSQQPIPASSHDWSQATDEDLEVHTSDSEGTERAKEVEKSRQEVAKREHRAEEEHERLEWEEQERQEALAVAWQAAVAEAEVVQQSVAKEKGHVGELQSESRGSSVGSSGQVAAYSPMTGASMGMLQVVLTVRKRKKKCSWAMAEEAKAEAAVSSSRKQARTGGLRGSGRKKGQTDKEDDDDEIEEVLGPVASCPEASRLGLVREESEFGGSGQGVPGPVYNEHMLMIQARQAAVMEHQALAMERMARAMEVQAVAVHPPGGLVGAAPVTGQVVAGGNGLGAWEEWAAPERSEMTVGGEVSDQGGEGDVEGMQE